MIKCLNDEASLNVYKTECSSKKWTGGHQSIRLMMCPLSVSSPSLPLLVSTRSTYFWVLIDQMKVQLGNKYDLPHPLSHLLKL